PMMRHFPAYDVLKVMMRGKGTAPAWWEPAGGISGYVRAMLDELGGVDLRVSTPVEEIRREGASLVVSAGDTSERYDRVVVATASGPAATLLQGVEGAGELAEACAAFHSFPTTIAIHRDEEWMPESRGDWSAINVRIEGETVWMTEWAGQRQNRPVFRTWLPEGRPRPQDILHEQSFEHLVVSPATPALQRLIAEHQGDGGIYLAGMYVTDVDTHNSAVGSAVAVASHLAPGSPNLVRLADHGGKVEMWRAWGAAGSPDQGEAPSSSTKTARS
ncbi:MAG: FAD-dependent oxidoreductase, partial [Deltaproteobacteria bacterium]|nr:FAD-dependent oxidoreductase [Deltaproteobacteria bacterium]